MSLTDDALDVQVELLRWLHSDGGVRYVQAECDTAFEVGGYGHIDGGLMYRRMLRESDTYAVSADIVDVLDANRRTIPPYSLHASDLPSNAGFVWFEKPMVLCDDTPERKPIVEHGFSWISTADGRDVHGLILFSWTLPLDERDHAHDEFADTERIRNLADGVVAGVFPPRDLWPMTSGVWAFDREPHATDTFRLLSTFLRFIGEPWLDEAPQRASRPATRRAARAHVDGTVNVIRLRRRPTRSGGAQTGTEREWAHRWMVGLPYGRWRNQWYPSKGVHRPKLIFPYEKGPPDKDLVVKVPVYRVDR